ncbi:MAG: metallophosphoesterase [Clostridiales bacterium]|jgi:predicted phosphodiesterase|nr:metallophosphoesterase [Clostridiales bacterium]
MIYITGDTHGPIDFGKLSSFAAKHSELTKADYMFVAGDFGGVWSERTLERDIKRYADLPFTVLFVDGNHENFDLLNAYKAENWHGGKVHKIADNVLHLMRGQIYELDGKSFFTFGGAESTDKWMRTENVSWWADEVPSCKDYDIAHQSLQKVGYKVDYIVTHSIDENTLYLPPLLRYGFEPFATNRGLSNFEETVTYKHWYFGHYHIDAKVGDKKTALYQKILKIE